jgi:hypothetical protein
MGEGSDRDGIFRILKHQVATELKENELSMFLVYAFMVYGS